MDLLTCLPPPLRLYLDSGIRTRCSLDVSNVLLITISSCRFERKYKYIFFLGGVRSLLRIKWPPRTEIASKKKESGGWRVVSGGKRWLGGGDTKRDVKPK